MSSFSAASFAQLSFNAGGALDFLRDLSELAEPRAVFTAGRRHRARAEVGRCVSLAERRRAHVPAGPGGAFDCATPLAAALKTLVVGAEATARTPRPSF